MPDAVRGAYAGLFGRAGRDPATRLEQMAATSASELLAAAADRLGRPCERLDVQGRAERAVVAASAQADLLIAARDGDRSRLGPRSLGKTTRFVVDHAPCPVLLVWPESAPDVATIPRRHITLPRQNPEHILLGVLGQEESLGGGALTGLGLTSERARAWLVPASGWRRPRGR